MPYKKCEKKEKISANFWATFFSSKRCIWKIKDVVTWSNFFEKNNFLWDNDQLTSSHFVQNQGAGVYKPDIPQYPPSHLQDYSTFNIANLEFQTIFYPCLDPNKWCIKNGGSGTRTRVILEKNPFNFWKMAILILFTLNILVSSCFCLYKKAIYAIYI